MDPLLVALVSGLFGGGLTGAVVAGVVSLLTQRRTFEHERQTRFLDLKRERYAALLFAAEEWVRAQWHQLDLVEGKLGTWSRDELAPLPPTRPVEILAEEIELLAPAEVGDEAGLLADAIRMLAGFDETRPAEAERLRQEAGHSEVSANYTMHRNRFVTAAKNDLGTS